MALDRWDPMREAVSLRDAMNSLFQESFVRQQGVGPGALPLDVRENDHEFVIQASIPGLKPDDVQVTVHNDLLTIRGETRSQEEKAGETWHLRERRSGSFRRTISLGTTIDSEKAHAKFEDGVLTLCLPKADNARPRQIRVNAN
ncbi:MAG: Hsp20/alpha crystallin family protein [Isosphaeraceae bacterium]